MTDFGGIWINTSMPAKEPNAVRKLKGKRTYNKATDSYIDRQANGQEIKPCVDDVLSNAARKIVPPPTIQTDRELKLFWLIIDSMPEGVYSALDASALGVYVGLVITYEDIIIQARTEPRMIRGSGENMVLNGLIRAQMELASKITSLGSRLGLDPIARSSIQAPEKRDWGDIW